MLERWYSEQQIRSINPDIVDYPSLSEDELKLAKSLARQLHCSWGINRINRGFQYGEIRTDTTHPNLRQVLTDLEKDFELADARNVIRVLKGMGFALTPAKQLRFAIIGVSIVSAAMAAGITAICLG